MADHTPLPDADALRALPDLTSVADVVVVLSKDKQSAATFLLRETATLTTQGPSDTPDRSYDLIRTTSDAPDSAIVVASVTFGVDYKFAPCTAAFVRITEPEVRLAKEASPFPPDHPDVLLNLADTAIRFAEQQKSRFDAVIVEVPKYWDHKRLVSFGAQLAIENHGFTLPSQVPNRRDPSVGYIFAIVRSEPLGKLVLEAAERTGKEANRLGISASRRAVLRTSLSQTEIAPPRSRHASTQRSHATPLAQRVALTFDIATLQKAVSPEQNP